MPASSSRFNLYGLEWVSPSTPLDAAIYCIQHGGQWKEESGKTIGAPLFDLYREVQTILWPEDDHHEWSDLILKTILQKRITTICGSKDSSKTRTIAKYALVDYFAFPKETLILISSTQLRSLELRVWGDLKSLFLRAKEVWPEAPGNVVDSLHGVFTDKVGGEEQAIRDIRRGIICIPVKDSEGQWQGMDRWCFPEGALVDTPTHRVPIQNIRVGDTVLSAIGPARVSAIHSRIAPELLRVYFKDGRTLDCTPNHRVLTQQGWKQSLELSVKDFVLSVNDSLRHLRETNAGRSLCQERGNSSGAWVACVKILERASDPRFSQSEGGYRVHNLGVEENPSYSVNGFVVHNCGIKQKRRRVMADETQWYASPFLSTLANLDKGNFKGVFVGNPLGEGDPLDKLAEPRDGWGTEGEISKTTTWENKWDGTTINLYGLDSPAIRFPGKFEYLINQEDIDRIVRRYGKESAEYWNQAVGIRPVGASLRRVVTREMAVHFGAQEPVIWRGSATTRVYGVDASYGGDRCVGCFVEFGMDINGIQVISFSAPTIIPVRIYRRSVPDEERLLPEDQIATFVAAECLRQGIPPQNVFFDSTGRGSLGTAFARLWPGGAGSAVNPVEFGGSPTSRPVCSDVYILDDKTRQRRLQRADEYYSKLVTEFWFSLRFAIEGRQVRSLPDGVLDELAAREWTLVRGDKREIETKDEFKSRFGRSCDLADAAVVALEGARRLGFIIAKMESRGPVKNDDAWKDKLRLRERAFRKSFTLDHTI